MSHQRFLELVHEMLELAPDTLNGQENLHEIQAWDSMAVLNFMAMADSEFGLTLAPKEVANAKSLPDLFKLLQAG